MLFFGGFKRVIKAYDAFDKMVSVGALSLIALLFLKLIFFPYGIFNFGQPGIYTEGLVSRAGVQNLNPLFVDFNEVDRDISRVIFSGLMKYDPAKQGIVDDMAKLSINEDKTVYTFVMRDGLKWHDNYPVTAEDVYFTFHDIVQHPAFQNEILKTNFSGVEIELVDAKTIKFTLEKPNSFFQSNFVTGILPHHLLASVEPDALLNHQFNRLPVGTGPYMMSEPIQSFPSGRMQVTLERNPYYYATNSEIETLRFNVYPSVEKLLDDTNSVNGVPKILGDKLLDFKNNGRFKLIDYTLPQYTAVFLNMEAEILKSDRLVRLALQKAIDKETIFGADEDKKIVDTPFLSVISDNEFYDVNKEQAQGALKEAGFLYGADDTEKVGIRYAKDGRALELSMITYLPPEDTFQYSELMRITEYLQKVWAEVGFSIKVEYLNADELSERIASRQYDMLLIGQSLGYNRDTYAFWHSSQADPRGQNFANYKSFQVDSLLEKIRSTFDSEIVNTDIDKLEARFREDIPVIMLYQPKYYYALDGKIEGLDMDSVVFPADRFARLGDWAFSD